MNKKIMNFGSINIDHVYRVNQFVVAGETIPSLSLTKGLGGKGANQSVALASAGAEVRHLGRISKDDLWAITQMQSLGVDTENVCAVDEASGHAIIQLDQSAENAIILHGGANQGFTEADLVQHFSRLGEGDYLLLQNECNLTERAIQIAHSKNIAIAFNPAPFTPGVLQMPLELLSILIVNEGEAQALSGQSELSLIEKKLRERFPNTNLVITLGAKGAVVLNQGERFTASAIADQVVDTTAAGDTFIGFYMAALLKGSSIPEALDLACSAAAITVSRNGAIDSIPKLDEVINSIE